AGTIRNFTSPALVPGRILTAPAVEVAVNTDGLELSGKGKLDDMPIDLTYRQGFGPEQKGRARVNGTVILSDAILRDFGVELPAGAVTGEGPAAIDVALVKDRPPQLTLTSTLRGIGLRLDALGWSKGARTKAALDLEASLSREPVVERLVLTAPGLEARGRITTRKGGGLDTAVFDSVVAGDWLDAAVTLTGRGRGEAPELQVTGGTLDLRRAPEGEGDTGAGPIAVALDSLRISEGIRLTDFRGTFTTASGPSGTFTAAVNGAAEVAGTVATVAEGTAVRVTSDNAGAVMAAAGIFDKGRGGALDLTLIPRGPKGEYNGKATFTRMRVQGAPALAELLSAVSVVGLLEQMNGDGLAFNNGEVAFVLTPRAVEITQGSAVGASLGISFAGLYLTDSGEIDLQGVISPIYLVNGVGQILTRRGEGLFGFNYRLTGTADDPGVAVNPLSVLTPGMFREIFRQRPPNLRDAEGAGGG
nr:AsmA-like C-terminal region-containing protein [Tabrizicola sp.]